MSKQGRRARTDLAEQQNYVSGHDFDGEDFAVVAWNTEDGRHAVLLPRSVSKLGGEAREDARELQRLGLELQRVADAIDEQVAQCRETGVSWSVIGWCLGTTGEAARQRWGSRG